MERIPSVTVLLFLTAIAAGQTEYNGDGTPAQRSEEIRWHLNRARSNPAAENTLRRTNYTGLSARPPLAPSALLETAATYHAIDMAASQTMTHDTLANSAYFNAAAHRANSTPDFAERARDLGFVINGGAENVSFGHVSAVDAYLAWWNSSGHRTNYFADRREIGIGNGRRTNGSNVVNYDAMTIANRDSINGTFTGTIFFDANSNNTYNAGEGIGGVRIELTNNGAAHIYHDISTQVGSFAVPLYGIPAGAAVQVFLINNTGSSRTFSVPSSHTTLNPISIANGQRRLIGTFTRANFTNAGFRNLVFSNVQPLVMPTVRITTNARQATVSFDSAPGHTYQVQWSPNLADPWNNLGQLQTGNGSTISVPDPTVITSTPRRFYRIIVNSP